jgi:hypothetical protein
MRRETGANQRGGFFLSGAGRGPKLADAIPGHAVYLLGLRSRAPCPHPTRRAA